MAEKLASLVNPSNEKDIKEVTKTISSRFKGAISPCGSRFVNVYRRVKDKDGTLIKPVKKIDAYKERQAYVPSCDYELIKNDLLEGRVQSDDSGLVFADLRFIPRNVHEAFDLVNRSTDTFDKLPDYIKKGFGSYENFIEAIKNGKANTIVSVAVQKEAIRLNEEANKPKIEAEKDGEK